MFIYILYMFREAMCPLSRESIVSIRHLVYYVCHSVQMTVWCAGLDETTSHQNLHTKRSSVQSDIRSIPDVVLIQLILLMMGTWLPETCRE
jgi:hypothetical protein